jgi:hypothetical protein
LQISWLAGADRRMKMVRNAIRSLPLKVFNAKWSDIEAQFGLPSKHLLFLLSRFAFCQFFGVDFGTEFIKVSCIKQSAIETVLNEQSRRLTPSFFALWNQTDPRFPRPKMGSIRTFATFVAHCHRIAHKNREECVRTPSQVAV